MKEVFGPVLVAMPFDDEAHAIALANDTEYGLGAGVYTTNIARAFRVARSVRAGTVGINEYTVWPNAPFGGMKQSGLGREGGRAVSRRSPRPRPSSSACRGDAAGVRLDAGAGEHPP